MSKYNDTPPKATLIKLQTTPCRCGYPAITKVGPYDGSNFILQCPNCGAKRARVSESTLKIITKVSSLVGAPQTITLRRGQTIPCISPENSPDDPAQRGNDK